MGRSAPVLGIVAFAVALAAAAGCGGRVVRLGDGIWGDGGCPHGQVNANELLWVGDLWVVTPGAQHTRVRDLARAQGVIGPNDDYVVRGTAAATLAMIADLYNAQESEAAKVKVLIMDGGTWDTMLANGSGESVAAVVSTFKQHLAKVASDGTVQHIIYYLMPELPVITGVAALRSPLQQACASSAVPCHFLDLQPLWVGHPEYTASNGMQPTEAGAQVIADAIWATMQQGCIAQ